MPDEAERRDAHSLARLRDARLHLEAGLGDRGRRLAIARCRTRIRVLALVASSPALRERLRLRREEPARGLADRELAAQGIRAGRCGIERVVEQRDVLIDGARVDAHQTIRDVATGADRVRAARAFEIGTRGRPSDRARPIVARRAARLVRAAARDRDGGAQLGIGLRERDGSFGLGHAVRGARELALQLRVLAFAEGLDPRLRDLRRRLQDRLLALERLRVRRCCHGPDDEPHCHNHSDDHSCLHAVSLRRLGVSVDERVASADDETTGAAVMRP